MNKEDLMKPRIKVNAPFPLMKNEVGSYLSVHEWNDTFTFGIRTKEAEHFYPIESFRNCPCFKEVEWWEDREESEMPKYMRFKTDYADIVFRPDKLVIAANGLPAARRGVHDYMLSHCTIATEADYLNYLNHTSPHMQTIEKPRTVKSNYLNRDVVINDNCGCTTGGFYEKEFTEHGFRGSVVGKWVVIYCNECKKPLTDKIHKRDAND